MNPWMTYQAARAVRALIDLGEEPEALEEIKRRFSGLGREGIHALLETPELDASRGRPLEVLESLVDNERLPIFVQALGSQENRVADRAAAALARNQNYEPGILLTLFTDWRVSKARLETIVSAQTRRLHPARLIGTLPDMSKEARGSIFRVLEVRADASIVPGAVRLAAHEDWWLRLHMVKLLGRFPTPEGHQAIIGLLHDQNQAVRLEAVRTLGRLKVSEAVAELCRCLIDPDLKVHTAAIDALIAIGDPSAVAGLIECLESDQDHVRRAAVEVLNHVVGPEAVPALVTAVRDPDWWVRARAVDALRSLGGEAVVEAAIELLGDDDPLMRREAADLLGAVPHVRSVESLIAALEDEDAAVRERVIDALGKSRDGRAAEPLLDMLGREPRMLPIVVRALGTVGDSRAVEPLCRLTSSESAEIRREAVQGLIELSQAKLDEDAQRRLTTTLESLGVRFPRPGSTPRSHAERSRTPVETERKTPVSSAGPAPGSPSTPTTPVDALEPAAAAAEPARAIDYQSLEPGTRLLDRYNIMRRIGGGGFGTVYLVEDTVVREELVLKVLNPQLTNDESVIRRFVLELKLTRKISHPAVIRIYDLLNLGRAHAISMEYFRGRDLGEVMRADGPMPPARVLGFAAQICEGLAAAHELGIIHRDVKPANILVGENDRIKIVDFGLASVSQSTRSRLTRSGVLVGTPEYISPEQITGNKVDGRSDLYSLGVVLYELLTGCQPFGGDNAVNVLFKHIEGEFAPMSSVVPDMPPAMERLIARALAKNFDDRPANARAMLDEIRAAGAPLVADAEAA